MRSKARECLLDHYPHEREIVVLDYEECGVEIDCENEDCGPHTLYFHNYVE